MKTRREVTGISLTSSGSSPGNHEDCTGIDPQPEPGRYLDPFLLVVVYCALRGGESQGLVVGTAAGWWTFVQIVAVIEMIFWLARPAGNKPARGS